MYIDGLAKACVDKYRICSGLAKDGQIFCILTCFVLEDIPQIFYDIVLTVSDMSVMVSLIMKSIQMLYKCEPEYPLNSQPIVQAPSYPSFSYLVLFILRPSYGK